MLKKQQKSNEGFTIIEVLIVLAIAGLILLIVFLAVPALQRNARNQGRRSDAGRISSAINNFVTNNNGKIPSTTGNLNDIISDAGTLGQYPNGLTSIAGVPTAKSYLGVVAGTAAGQAAVNLDSMLIVTKAVCGPGTAANTLATSTDASDRSAVLIYPQESGTSGSFTSVCLSVQ